MTVTAADHSRRGRQLRVPVVASNGGSHDAVVVGGGPAGATAALLLARRGWSVAVVHRPAGRRPRVGETVPPSVVGPLAHLGLWEQFEAAGHLPVPGTVVAWGRAKPYEADYLFDPYGCGWRLDRARFDQMLLGAALDAGVDVHFAPGVECRRGGTEPNGGWAVRAAERSFRAHWLIDASGRASCVARRQGVERTRLDRLIGLAHCFTAPPAADPRTVIETGELGWWYYAALPEGRAVAVLFTDADLLPGDSMQRERRWTELAGRTQLIAGCLDSASDGSSLVAAAACSGSLARPSGQGWLAVGDAAQSWDPLSGQGITKALDSAIAAVEVLGAASSSASAPDLYADRMAAEYRDYLRVRSAYYGRETRWARSPFWRRRIAA